MLHRTRNFSTAVLSALLLILGTIVLTQCSAGPQRTEPPAQAPVAPANAEHEPDAQGSEQDRDSGRHRDEHDKEEDARIKSVARALKTIGADPEKARTYGFPP